MTLCWITGTMSVWRTGWYTSAAGRVSPSRGGQRPGDKGFQKAPSGKEKREKNPFSNEKRDSGAKQEPVSETAAADRLPVVSPQQLPNVVRRKEKQVPAEVKPPGR